MRVGRSLQMAGVRVKLFWICLQGQSKQKKKQKQKKVLPKEYVIFILFTFKVPGMFPGYLEKSLEATNFKTLTAVVGFFTKSYLI